MRTRRLRTRSERTAQRLAALLAAVLLACWPTATFAVEEEGQIRVVLDNGDQISGKLKNMVEGKLLVETTWAGTLEIAFSAILGLDLAEPARVELADGRQLEGSLVLEEGKLRVGDTTITLAEVSAINPPVIPPVTWRLSLSLGANLQSGNTDQTAAHVAVAAWRETARGRFQGKIHLNRTEEDSETTASNSFLGLQYDFLLSERRFAYVKGDFLEDEFRNLDLRTVLGLGLGYQVRDTDRIKFKVQGGLAYLTEVITGHADEYELTVETGYDFTWKLGKWGTFSELLRVRPSFEDDAYQLRFENTLRTAITQDWALKLEALLDYDSEPPPGVAEEDLLFIVALEYALKR